MIQQIENKVVCPKCQTENDVILWEKVNVTMNPDLKEKLFSGTLNQLLCKECGHQSRIDIPLIYHDMDKKFFIHFAPEYPMGEEEELITNLNQETMTLFDESYENRLRVAFDFRTLMEKIKIFDDGLDDRSVEVCKTLARLQLKLMEGEAFYDAKSEGGLQFFFIDAEDIKQGNFNNIKEFTVPMDMYETVSELVDEKDNEDASGFRIIGIPFAVAILSEDDNKGN